MPWVLSRPPPNAPPPKKVNMSSKCHLTLGKRTLFAIFSAFLVIGCSSSGNKPKPAELQPLLPMVAVRQAWVNAVGATPFDVTLAVHGSRVVVGAGNGTVAMIDTDTGADVWRLALGSDLTASAGTDGFLSAVVTDRNEVVALVEGKAVWRQRLNSAVYTAPLVAGQRIFVLGADRTLTAFDGNSGARLWSQSRPGEPLVLKQSGVMLAVGDTLVAGMGGRLVGFNPNNGSVRWDVPVALPRGSNDVERMVDLVGPASRVGNAVCVRAYQVMVGCVDATRGRLTWSQAADGRQGLHGDDSTLFGAESDGKVVAWKRADGQKAWTHIGLLHRSLAAPLLLGRSVAVPDGFGFVHLLSRDTGAPMARLTTDGTPIVSAPVLAGDTLLALTQGGKLFAWRPQ